MENQTKQYKNVSSELLRFDAEGKEQSILPGATVSLTDSPYVSGLVRAGMLTGTPAPDAVPAPDAESPAPDAPRKPYGPK